MYNWYGCSIEHGSLDYYVGGCTRSGLFVCLSLCRVIYLCGSRLSHARSRDLHVRSNRESHTIILKLGQSMVPLFEICPIEYQYVNRCSREKFEEALLEGTSAELKQQPSTVAWAIMSTTATKSPSNWQPALALSLSPLPVRPSLTILDSSDFQEDGRSNPKVVA